MGKPIVDEDPAYQLLHDEHIDKFNAQKQQLKLSNLAGKDYRGVDLRNLNAEGLDLSDSYFRNTDLRGIDFRATNLEGCSFSDAKISGCYFPESLPATEIMLSVEKGTRVRYRRP